MHDNVYLTFLLFLKHLSRSKEDWGRHTGLWGTASSSIYHSPARRGIFKLYLLDIYKFHLLFNTCHFTEKRKLRYNYKSCMHIIRTDREESRASQLHIAICL